MFVDSIIAKIGKTLPNAKSQADNIDFFRITYLSDGLKVTGYMATPKKAGKYPCVIVNRGGNRESGAWNDFTIRI
jgi:cephalosporin-C deacetylase-like acetyl esterase